MDLNGILNESQKELDALTLKITRLDSLKCRAEELTELREVVAGLKRRVGGERNYRDDPGKYEPAYFFVEELIDKDAIATSDQTKVLQMECPNCHKTAPVVMRYEQTEDSPDYDEWRKDVFSICCGRLNRITSFVRESRFL